MPAPGKAFLLSISYHLELGHIPHLYNSSSFKYKASSYSGVGTMYRPSTPRCSKICQDWWFRKLFTRVRPSASRPHQLSPNEDKLGIRMTAGDLLLTFWNKTAPPHYTYARSVALNTMVFSTFHLIPHKNLLATFEPAKMVLFR